MTVPEWWEAVLLGLASFRLWRILAVDTVLDGVRRRVYRQAEYDAGREDLYRFRLDEFVGCPWCFGFWITLGWFGLWQVWGHGILEMSVVLALSAAVGFLARWDA